VTVFRQSGAEDAVRAAAAALARAWRVPVEMIGVAELGEATRRNIVVRAAARAPGVATTPIIIKASREAGDVTAASGFGREWAAGAYLARSGRGATFAAPLIAADLESGVLVKADLGATPVSLVAPLLEGHAAAAEAALIAYAEGLARLHEASIGCRAEHGAILLEGFPRHVIPPPAQGWRSLSGQCSAGGGAGDADRLRIPTARPCPARRGLLADGLPDMLVRRAGAGRRSGARRDGVSAGGRVRGAGGAG
jgi:hypothetical protein